MAVIEKDGLYRVGDKETGSQIQYLKGTVVPDDAELQYVGPFPEAKEAAKPENKKADAPANKAADK